MMVGKPAGDSGHVGNGRVGVRILGLEINLPVIATNLSATALNAPFPI